MAVQEQQQVIQRNPYLAPLKGLRLDIAGTINGDEEMPECSNVYFDKLSNIRKKDGYKLKGGNLPLNGEVMVVETFTKSDKTQYTIAVTTKDCYVYDIGTGNWVLISPTYTIGTVDVTTGTKLVTGTLTVWQTFNNVKAGDQIGFGTTDQTAVSVWYTVASVTDNYHLQLSANFAEATLTNSIYVVRKLNSGASTDMFSTAVMDDRFIVSNGVDPIIYYTGSGIFQALEGDPPLAKYLEVYHDYLVLGYTIEGGQPFPKRVRWCDTGDPTTWTNPGNINNSGFLDLIDYPDFIMGLSILYDRIIAIKQNTIYSGYLISTSQIFEFDIVVSNVGCIAGFSIGNKGDQMFFLGNDDVYSFNGITYDRVGSPIKDTLLSTLSPSYREASHNLIIPELDEYILFVPSSNATFPDLIWVYNYKTRGWTKGTSRNITATGFYKKETGLRWQDDTRLWSEANTRWEDQTLVTGSNVLLYGDSAGYVYEVDYLTPDENGVAIDAYFDTKDFEMGLWDWQKYWCRLDCFGAGNDVDLYYSIDEGSTFTFIGTYQFTGAMQRLKMDFRITSEKIRFRFRNSTLGETFFIRMYELWWAKAGRVVG